MISISTSGGGDLARALSDATRRARELPHRIAGDVAEPAADAVLDSVRAERGSLTLSNAGVRLDVDTSVRGGDGAASLDLSATPRSGWGLASGAKAHEIRPRRRALRTDDGRFFAAVRHPGTRRRPLWRNATRAAQPAITDVANQAARDHNPFKGT